MIKAIKSIQSGSTRTATFKKLDATEKFFITEEGRIFSVKNYTKASEKGLCKDINDNQFEYDETNTFISNILGANVTVFRFEGGNTLGF